MIALLRDTYRRTGLYGRLLIVFLLTTLLANCIVVLLAVRWDFARLNEISQNKADKVLKMIELSLDNYALTNTRSKSPESHSVSQQLMSVDTIRLTSADGTINYDHEIVVPLSAPVWLKNLGHFKGIEVNSEYELTNGKGIVSIYFRVSPNPYYDALWLSIQRQMLLLTIGTAIVFLCSLFALRMALAPLKRLTAATATMAEGDLTVRLPIKHPNSDLTSAFAAFNKMAEETEHLVTTLAQRQSTLAAVFNASPVGIIQVDREGNNSFINPTMRKFLGIDEESISSTLFLDTFHPDDKERVVNAWLNVQDGDRPLELVYRQMSRDGNYRWVKSNSVRTALIPGQNINYVVFVTDISNEIKLQQAAERSLVFYRTLAEINSAIINSEFQDELFESVSRIFVQVGGFNIASFTYADHVKQTFEANTITRNQSGEITKRNINYDFATAKSQGNSLSARALLTDSLQLQNDFDVAATTINVNKLYVELAVVRSSIALPIHKEGKVVAAFSLAADRPGYFTQDIQDYVQQICANVSHALDNFDRKQELQLALTLAGHSEQRLATTLRSIGDAVLVADGKGKITLLNPVAESLTGWMEEEAQGRDANEILNLVGQEPEEAVVSLIDEIIQGRTPSNRNQQVFLVAKNGTRRPVAETCAPIRYGSSDFIDGVVVVVRDQTEDYAVKEALRQGESRYATLIETLPIGIFVFEPDKKQFFINSELRKILKMTKRSVTIYDVEAMVHPSDRLALRHYFDLASASGETVITDYYRYRRDDGDTIWAKMRLTPTTDSAGKITNLIGGVLDVTAEREHIRQIEALSTMYATLSKVNYLVVAAEDEKKLLDEVCSTILSVPNFDQVCFFNMHSGVSAENLKNGNLPLEISRINLNILAELETLMRQFTLAPRGECTVVNDCFSDARLSSDVQLFCANNDINSVLILPITKADGIFGSFFILSRETYIFYREVQELVEEVGEVVSFALTKMEADEQRSAAELKLSRNEERLRLGLSVNQTGMFEINFITGKIILDEISTQLLAVHDDGPAREYEISEFGQYLPESLRLNLANADGAVVAKAVTSDTFSHDAKIAEADGGVKWLRVYGSITAERTADNKPVRLIGFMLDITHLKEQEDREFLAATVFDKSSESILILDNARRIVMFNQSFADTYGYELDEVINQTTDIFRSSRHDNAFYEQIQESVHVFGSWQGEWWRLRKDGSEHPALAVISVVRDSTGTATHQVIQEIDISERKEAERRISNLAYHDELTNLPNRSLLRDRVEQAVATASRERATLALLFLDLDHFKNINDSLGHATGDRLLQEVASRLLRSVRRSDTVGRLGGDEFLMLLPEANADDAAHVAQKVLEECIRPFALDDHNLAVTPSIGIAMYPRDGSDYDELLKKADTAMYRAKDEGRNGYRFFTPEMNQAVFQRMILESSLRKAIDNQEFTLHYQPKFAIDGLQLVGVEALLRWHQPEMGMISPAQFIPVAEESGLIVELGQWVLLEACRQIKEWLDDQLPAPKVSINFSTRQFTSRSVEQSVFAALENVGLTGERLEIEITESLLAQDMEYTLAALSSLKQHGISISVDDFGTGYSSLSYLKRFPIDRLKIDQSFVRDIERDADDRAIASAVITMGHSLGMQVIAEGVETQQQLAILREMNCDEIQGYLLGKPMEAGEMTTLIKKKMNEGVITSVLFEQKS